MPKCIKLVLEQYLQRLTSADTDDPAYIEMLSYLDLPLDTKYSSIKWVLDLLFSDKVDSKRLFRKAIFHMKNYNVDNVTKERFETACRRKSNSNITLSVIYDRKDIFEEIFKNRKNPYDPNYIMFRDGCSLPEALKKIEEYKSNKATNLEGFINRYGDKLGRMKFEKFKSTSIKNFIHQQDLDDETSKRLYRENSKRCVEYYLSRGLAPDIKEAEKMVSRYQKNNSGVHIDYYLSRGVKEDEARKIISDIDNSKLVSNIHNLSYKTLHEEMGLTLTEAFTITTFVKSPDNTSLEAAVSNPRYKNVSKVFLTEYFNSPDKINFILSNPKRASKELSPSLDELNPFFIYSTICRTLTNENNLASLKNYGKRDDNGEMYQLDHKLSIKDGFTNNIDPKIISNLANLRYISRHENAIKHAKSCITLNELLKEINKCE